MAVMNEADARQAFKGGFAARGISPSLAELQIVQAISAGESGGKYGGAFASTENPQGANNFGSVQCQGEAPCGPGCTPHIDTHADGSVYNACFRVYDSPETGAADFIRELYRRPGVAEAARRGSAHDVSEAMNSPHTVNGHFIGAYSETPIDKYAAGILWNAKRIAANMGETLLVSMAGNSGGGGGGGGFGNGGSSSTQGEELLALLVLGLTIYKAIELASKRT